MNRSLKTTAAAGLAAAAVVLATTTLTDSANADGDREGRDRRNDTAYALGFDGTTLSRLDVDSQRGAKPIGTVTGLVGDAKLVGIDIRPATGVLYGLGNASGVYTIDDNGVATKVGSLVAASTSVTPAPGTPITLAGSAFGVDFNPAADRLRVISNTGQSLRIDVANGATSTDTSPNIPGVTTTKTGIEAVAYTNNDAASVTATGTSLYDIDAGDDALYQQVPANAGTLVLVGKLGVDFSSVSSFDIASRLVNGVAVKNKAYLVGKVGDRNGLYEVDLTSGAVELERGLAPEIASIALRHR